MVKSLYNGAMLKEDKNVRQVVGEPPRRWFSDDYFDLIIWQDDEGDVFAFQLCYDRYGDEHALVWHEGREFRHYRVDDGTVGELHKATPMMVADGVVDAVVLRKRFVRASENLDAVLVQVLLRRMDEWQADAI